MTGERVRGVAREYYIPLTPHQWDHNFCSQSREICSPQASEVLYRRHSASLSYTTGSRSPTGTWICQLSQPHTAALTHPPPTRFHGLTLTKDLTTAARHWTVPHEEVHVSDVSVLYSNNWTTLYSFDASSTALFNRCFSCCKIEELNSDTLTSQ